MNDKQRIAAAVLGMAEMFRQTVSNQGMVQYVAALEDLSPDSVERAVLAAGKKCKFFPPPATIRELAGEMTVKARALKAWDKAQWARRAHGGYRTVRFSDPATSATIRSMGGWPAFCWCEEDEHFFQKRFLDFYELIVGRGVGTEEVETLLGLCAQENGHSGNGEAKGLAIATGEAAVEIDCELPTLPGQKPRNASLSTEVVKRIESNVVDETPPLFKKP